MNNEVVANRTYSEIDTDLRKTLLLGAAEFNPSFIKNHALAGNKDHDKPYSVPRLQDMSLGAQPDTGRFD